MDQIDIVQLNPDAWQDYKALRLEALHTEPQAFGSAYADNLQHPESFWRGRLQGAASGQNAWLLFAETRSRLVGMIGAHLLDGDDVAEIISTYVTPDFRGQGISRALMAALLDELSQSGAVTTARLGVNVNQHAAVRLYASFGFRETGTENARMGDGCCYDEYIMEKRLE